MPIELKPETEALIRQNIRRGGYRNATEFVERAVAMLHEQEEWLSAHKEEIAARIEAGFASTERGDLLSDEESRQRMAARKHEWLLSSRNTRR